MYWAKHIPEGSVCHEMATMMDFLPTLARITGAQVPSDRKIDGYDLLPLITDKNAKSHYDFFCYYGRDGKLAAIRKGNWKLHLLEPSEKWVGKQPVIEALLNTKPTTPLPWLYNLSSDIGETQNVAASNPEIVRQLKELALSFDSVLSTEIRQAYIKK